MPRQKIDPNETPEETEIRKKLEAVSSIATRAEKLSWNRLYEKMSLLLDDLAPLEAEIIELTNHKIPIFDNISKLRKEMVKECIHPKIHLVYHNNHIICHFCEKKISIPTKRPTKNGNKKI